MSYILVVLNEFQTLLSYIYFYSRTIETKHFSDFLEKSYWILTTFHYNAFSYMLVMPQYNTKVMFDDMIMLKHVLPMWERLWFDFAMLQIKYIYHMEKVDIFHISNAIEIPRNILYTKMFSLNGGYICYS